jgi:hypothetical protein
MHETQIFNLIKTTWENLYMQHPQSMMYIYQVTHLIIFIKSKMFMLDGRKSFGQYICNYIFCITIHQLNQTFFNFVSH